MQASRAEALPAAAGRARLRVSGIDPAALRRLHLYTDVVLVTAGWLLAWGLRRLLDPWLEPINPFETYAMTLPLIVVPWIFSCWLFGIYQSGRIATFVEQIQAVLRGTLLGFGIVSAIGFFAKELDFGRLVVVFSAGINLVLQGASRAFYRRAEKALRGSGRHDVRTLIFGGGTTGARLLQRIQDHPESGYRVVGFLDDSEALRGRAIASRPVLGTSHDLRRAVIDHGIEEVVIAIPSLEHARMLSLVLECEDLDVVFRVVTSLFEVLTTSARVDLIDDLPLVTLGGNRRSWSYHLGKRVFDLGVSLALLVLSAPLWLWWLSRIKLDSPGPALFAQTRIGQHGRPFEMYKLRTMRRDAAPYAPAPAAAGDPRVTPYGAWLRKTSIDELPQLWNVVRGEMSLVGPRPEMPFIVEQYQGWERRRLIARPGITGLWQILGRKDLPMRQNLQYDFYYIHNRSFLFDLSILIRTLVAVGSARGAF